MATDRLVILPYDKIKPETLLSFVEDVIGREGTDYGEPVFSFQDKVEQVMLRLKSGAAVITFDRDSQTFGIAAKDDPQIKRQTG